jgi:hypothetical protein
MVNIVGKMVRDMRVIMRMIKRMDLVYFFIMMEENMKECGLMVNNMVKVQCMNKMEHIRKVNGGKGS